MRLRMSVLAVLAAVAMSACAATPEAHQASAPTSAASPAPTELVEPAPSAGPSRSPSTSPPPSRQPTKPPTPATTPAPVLGPIKCTGSAATGLPRAGGAGPAGSIAVTGSDEVALTFDDGPDPVNTPKILDLLKQCGVKATFCVVGVRAEKNPAIIRRIHAQGHTLCNHTWHHGKMGDKDDATVRWYLAHTNEIIRQIVPDAPNVGNVLPQSLR